MKRAVAVLLALSLAGCGVAFRAPWPDDLSWWDRLYLRGVMKDTWRYIDYYVSETTGFPYDSNQARDITNTTNIGLYLASVCMAYRMGYVGEAYALARVTRILDSLDTYDNWGRLYSNWLDPEGKVRTGKPGWANISDYNKLPAGIVVVRQTFPQLAQRCTDFLDAIPWEAFADPAGSDRICYEFEVASRQTRNPINFYQGEDKILGHFLMIASGKIPPSTWDAHSREEEERYGYRYFKFGWQGGGLFMQFICDLFLETRGTSLGRSAANFAWAQVVHSMHIGAPAWGWSACVGPDGTYLGMNMLVDEVVTPHASALAVSVFPREVLENLRRLERLGLRKPFTADGRPRRFGFRDSVDWKTGEMADKFLVLDQAMLFLSLVNYCEDGLLWRTFDADPLVRNGKQLITEFREAATHLGEEEAYVRGLHCERPSVFWYPSPTPEDAEAEFLDRTLWVRSLSPDPLRGAVLRWRLFDAAREIAASGEAPFALGPRATKRVLPARLPIAPAQPGEDWVFECSIRSGEQTLLSRTDTLHFPNYVRLEEGWVLAAGDDPAWSDPAFDDRGWRAARVGIRWEDDLLPDYDGEACYRLRFTVPADAARRWQGVPLAVLLGAVDDADVTYLNGQEIGRSGAFPPESQTAYNTPRLYPVDSSVLTGENVLAVRASDWGGNGGIWRGPVLIGPVIELSAIAHGMQ